MIVHSNNPHLTLSCLPIAKQVANDSVHIIQFDQICDTSMHPPPELFRDCTSQNCLNFNLDYNRLTKSCVSADSLNFGFTKYDYRLKSGDPGPCVIKGLSHSCAFVDNYAPEFYYDEVVPPFNPDTHVAQKILVSKAEKELNVFIFRNPADRTNRFTFATFDRTVYHNHLNWKSIQHNNPHKRMKVPIQPSQPITDPLFFDKVNKLTLDIGLDFGRLEFIPLIDNTYALIDINPTPGGKLLAEPDNLWCYHNIVNAFIKVLH